MSDPSHYPYGQAPHGPAGYGPGGYGPGGYGPPGYGLQGFGPPPVRATNSLAIASLVLAFLCAPVGLGLGIAARRQIRRTGEDGDGLALAGIIVGGIATGLYVLLITVLVIAWFGLVAGL
jgi:hypothetical protein